MYWDHLPLTDTSPAVPDLCVCVCMCVCIEDENLRGMCVQVKECLNRASNCVHPKNQIKY